MPNMWFLGLTVLAFQGCFQGMTGYLPFYLRQVGYDPATADGTVAVFNASAVAGVIPLALLSDRIGSRKAIAFFSIVTMMIGIGLLPVAHGAVLWMLMILAGEPSLREVMAFPKSGDALLFQWICESPETTI